VNNFMACGLVATSSRSKANVAERWSTPIKEAQRDASPAETGQRNGMGTEADLNQNDRKTGSRR
jgi:hypothetical protein